MQGIGFRVQKFRSQGSGLVLQGQGSRCIQVEDKLNHETCFRRSCAYCQWNFSVPAMSRPHVQHCHNHDLLLVRVPIVPGTGPTYLLSKYHGRFRSIEFSNMFQPLIRFCFAVGARQGSRRSIVVSQERLGRCEACLNQLNGSKAGAEHAKSRQEDLWSQGMFWSKTYWYIQDRNMDPQERKVSSA